MKVFGSKSYLLLALALLTGCTRDPNKLKLKYLKSGEAYFTKGQYQEAAIQFRNAIQIDPRFAEAHYQLSRAYLGLKNPEAAYRELMETVTLAPQNSEAQLQLATLLIGARQYNQAQATAKKILNIDPANVRAHEILGEIYTLARDFPNAVLELAKAIELDPHRITDYAALGAVYLAAGKPADAEATYKKALEVDPKSAQAHVALGEFYVSQHRVADAEVQLLEAGQLDPHGVQSRLFLARIYTETGRLNEAGKLYAQLKIIAADDPTAYQALGLFFLSTGQKQKAVSEFQALVSSKPKDALAKLHLIETLIDLNRFTEAAPLTQQVLKSNPSDPRALLANGRILIAQHNYKLAMEALRRP